MKNIITFKKDDLIINIDLRYLSKQDLEEICIYKNISFRDKKILENFFRLPKKDRRIYKKELKRILEKFQ